MIELPFKTSRRDLLSFLAIASTPMVVKNIEARNMPDGYRGNLVMPDVHMTTPVWTPRHCDNLPDDTVDRLNKALGVTDWGRFDVVHDILYDSLVLRRGTITPHYMTLFTDVWAQSDKTIAHTNMCMSSVLPAPQMFLIDRIYAITTTVNDSFVRLCQNFSFSFLKGQRVYGRAPLPFISSLCGKVEEERAIDYRSTGGLGIETQQCFYGMLDGKETSITEDVDIRFCLEGILVRGIC